MLGSVITKLRLSESAVVVQNLLELYGAGTELALTPAQIGNKLVQKVYDERPALIQGKEGKRPHKLSLAAVALAWGVKHMVEHPEARSTMHLALGTVLLEIAGKPEQYAFSGNDWALFAISQARYLEHAPAAEVGPIISDSTDAMEREKVSEASLSRRKADLDIRLKRAQRIG